eukprot:CAMPEP_0172575102 /NCGR_PEP_ID=MMETSP1067-20121228/137042_1 /TAXON_ID=265564 ORGANISM="Thalassiosira punctigera, Strain Tpunct2005C2" /NCGR_SAMPLE_ID=MMETSP1067 /ASSEMBLY_ACC=CAM_ASM_000444 /LENGTH=549 /DNA_ID=CAMNT_0013367745 /DNA_START=62 /DNA_END=1711 /DNA_ORIENTATION=+
MVSMSWFRRAPPVVVFIVAAAAVVAPHIPTARGETDTDTDTAYPPVPVLTRDAFDDLPVPGKYFLRLAPANCPVKRCKSFDPFWDMLAARAPPGTLYRADCGRDGDAGFCKALIGPGDLANIESKGGNRLLAVQFQKDGSIGMEKFHQDLFPDNVYNWVLDAMSKNLQPLPIDGTGTDSPERKNGRENHKAGIALLMLSRDGLGVRSDIWCRFFGLAIEQNVDIHMFLHDASDQIANGPLCTTGVMMPDKGEVDAVNANRIHAIPGEHLLHTQWGTASLVKAIVFLLRSVVSNPSFHGADRYVVVSDNSVPLVDPKTMLLTLSGPGYSYGSRGTTETVSVFQGMDPGRPNPLEVTERYNWLRPRYERSSREKSSRQHRVRVPPVVLTPPLDLARSEFQTVEMWMVLDRAAGAWFAETTHEYFAEFELSQAPEEAYFVSLCHKFGLPYRIASAHRPNATKPPTATSTRSEVKSESESHPMYTQWSSDLSSTSPETLTEITPEMLKRWGCGQTQSFLFARKISKKTNIDLPWMKYNYKGTDASYAMLSEEL